MTTTRPFVRCALAAASIVCLTGLAQAQTTSMNFELDDVWLLPDVSHPGDPPLQMTGTFRWTYPAGSFENGSGAFLDLNLPWYGTDLQGLVIIIDLPSIEFVKRPPITTVNVDLMMHFLTDLDPVQPAVINPAVSIFEVEAFGVTHQGHLISGAVIPAPPMSLAISGVCPSFQFKIEGATRLSQVALLRAGNLGIAMVPAGKPCAGTLLSLSGGISLVKMLSTNAAGKVTINANVPPGACGSTFLQALDLQTCRVSAGVLLP